MASKKNYWHPQFFIISLHYWNVEVAFAINLSKEEIIKRFKKYTAAKDILEDVSNLQWDIKDKSTKGQFYPLSRGQLICLKMEEDKFGQSVGNLVHEVTHAIHYMLRYLRIPLTEDTEEVYTYGIEHLTTEALKALYD